MTNTEQQQWDKIDSSTAEDEVSWFQPYPKTSMEFVELFNLQLSANIIDIGGGDNIKHIIDLAKKSGGTTLFIIEQESYQNKAPIECAKEDLEVMTNWGY